MTTKAWLEGHQFDLEDLAQLFATGDVRVVRDADADAYYLSATEIDNPPEGMTYYGVARRLLSHINGISRISKPDFRPVQLTDVYDTPTAQRVVTAPVTGEIRLRMHAAVAVFGGDGQPKPDVGADGQSKPAQPSPCPDRLALAATNPIVAEALDLMGSVEPLGFPELYKVHEIIRDAIKPKKITELGWADAADDSAFRASANRADVSGSDARHARNSGPTPTRTMTLAEARSFVSGLVAKWLESLSSP